MVECAWLYFVKISLLFSVSVSVWLYLSWLVSIELSVSLTAGEGVAVAEDGSEGVNGATENLVYCNNGKDAEEDAQPHRIAANELPPEAVHHWLIHELLVVEDAHIEERNVTNHDQLVPPIEAILHLEHDKVGQDDTDAVDLVTASPERERASIFEQGQLWYIEYKEENHGRLVGCIDDPQEDRCHVELQIQNSYPIVLRNHH